MTTVLVAGAAGEVGSQVVRALVAAGLAVRALVHRTPVPGAESVTGDLADRSSIERAARGCEAVVFITPHHADEQQLGFNVVEACEAAGVRRLVYIAAFRPLSRIRFVQRLLDGGVGLIGPHYRAKLAVARRVTASRCSPVVLCPSNFYQNDETSLPDILDGRYTQPLGGRAVTRVDTRDIADAVVRAVTGELASGAYPLVGPGGWSGPTCAALWSEALGRPVAYAGDDTEQWLATVGRRMDATRAADFARTFRIIQRFAPKASARAIAATTAVLGKPPRDYASYVNDAATRSRSTSPSP